MIKEDGFNNRKLYVMNSNDRSTISRNGAGNFDNSLAKMNSERRGLVQTTNSSVPLKPIEEVKGNKENFIIRNNHINNFGKKPNKDNYVSRALNNNMFKKAS